MTKRRADLTFADNRGQGRHGWLRLTPAYSVRIVRELLTDTDPSARILDPFSGSGTTALCAAELGHFARGVELNPFLVWLGSVKLRRHHRDTLARASQIASEILERAGDNPASAPPIHNIARWWSEPVLEWLCGLAGEIDALRRGAVRDLLTVAFLRTMMSMSGAAFNHVSMSFREPMRPDDVEAEGRTRFTNDVQAVVDGARIKPVGDAAVLQGDARDLRPLGRSRFDVVITSPPYPNRMSYVRELRPYMYWTRHLVEARQAGELDWQAIGGTWGVATSRLKDWKRTFGETPCSLGKLLPHVTRAHAKNGPILAAYLDRYFEDTERHLGALRRRVKKGGVIHYIVGNSSFYGQLVPVESLYAELMERAGFHDPEIVIIRKRNSNKKLYEFRVTAKA